MPAIWYMISMPHSMEELNRIFFDILVFGSVRDESSDRLFQIPKWMTIYLEISSDLN